MNSLTIVRKNLTRRKLRAFLMIFAIFIAFLIFGVLGAVRQAFSGNNLPNADNRLITTNKIHFTQPLPVAYVQRIKAVDGVQIVSYSNWFGGYFQDPKNTIFTFAVEPETYLETHPELILADDQRAAWLHDRTGLLIGADAAKKWGWKLGDKIPLSSNIYSQKSNGSHSWDFTISAIYNSSDPAVDTTRLYFNHDYFDESVSFGRDMVGFIVFTTANPLQNEQIMKAVDALFANSPYETATDTAKAFNKAFADQLGNIALIVTLVVTAAFVTILMIVGNTMMMAIRERTREIGVLKSLGFSPSFILRLVLGESFLLAIVGGVLGTGLAVVLVTMMSPKISTFLPGLVITPTQIGEAAILILALGLVTGLLPAWNAMRLNIAAALGRV